jgi:hypothetical protein
LIKRFTSNNRESKLSASINILTYPPHFGYTSRLLESIAKFDRKSKSIPIYIFFDSHLEARSFGNLHKRVVEKTGAQLISIESAISDMRNPAWFGLGVEAYASEMATVPSWGAGGHRNWVAKKRTAALLYLQSLGFEVSWSLDSESQVLAPVSLTKILDDNCAPPRMLFSEGDSDDTTITLPEHLLAVFEKELPLEALSRLRVLGLRQNDFWPINLQLFRAAIEKCVLHFQSGISSWMNGSEQWIYEAYVFTIAESGQQEIDLVTLRPKLSGNFPTIPSFDLHGARLLKFAVENRSVDLRRFVKELNSNYFDLSPAFRGDYLGEISSMGPRGRYITRKLNVRIAVSNYNL